MNLKDINQKALSIMLENVSIDERFLEKDSPSIKVNEYIDQANSLLYQITRTYFQGSDNRSRVVPELIELMKQLNELTELSIETLRKAVPEDANE